MAIFTGVPKTFSLQALARAEIFANKDAISGALPLFWQFNVKGFAAFLNARFWALFISVISKSNFFEPFKFALPETEEFTAIIAVFKHKLKDPSLNSIVKSGLFLIGIIFRNCFLRYKHFVSNAYLIVKALLKKFVIVPLRGPKKKGIYLLSKYAVERGKSIPLLLNFSLTFFSIKTNFNG
ncbi:hypothetical protein GGTG_11558 [Gaeumannomyces tritici R3-111a-1]|uniref:Uncharacterized protein n=1 Tax=Gaeumannomyces tritici (strain R3-111a-1) TaxID=644352 RepID=J3PDI5_GAET3|nr:hypothetical protein GGTG_11558 [Gaeumannomyces tritici R3-111a-1]EJT70535.1 hypothetical protein GGTG_11558 [Gaeumannomyces tritici R3-111a-1]